MRAIIVSFVFFLMVRCTSDAPLAGGTNSTDNAKVIVSVQYPDGTPVSKGIAILRPSHYLAEKKGLLKAKRDTAQAAFQNPGEIVIDNIDNGYYTLEINDRVSFAALLRFTIDNATNKLQLSCILKPYATLKGMVRGRTSGYVTIGGLERYVPIDTTGTFTITNLPSATVLPVFISTNNESYALPDSIHLISNDTTAIKLWPSWKRGRRIHFRAGVSGIDLPYDAPAVPVCIRLSAAVFDFEHAQPEGADLRFIDNFGVEIPHEIEMWDSRNKKAVVWIKPDTLYAQNDMQSVLMLWGNESPAETDPAGAVFDTSHGYYSGVWHMDTVLSRGTFPDASIAQRHGSILARNPFGVLSQGTMGGSFYFDESITAQIPLGLNEKQEYSISLWVKPDTGKTNARILGTDSLAILLWSSQGDSGIFTTRIHRSPRATEAQSAYVKAHQWHHITLHYIRNGTIKLFIDGVLSGTTTDTEGNGLWEPLYIGGACVWKESSRQVFSGEIDELRIQHKVFENWYYRALYETQRPEGIIIKFGNYIY